jgi:hypothetical protein
MRGIAVLYRWAVAQDLRGHFVERWQAAAIELRSKFDEFSACLLSAENGDFLALVRWPNEQARALVFERLDPVSPGILAFAETRLGVEHDMLNSVSPQGYGLAL